MTSGITGGLYGRSIRAEINPSIFQAVDTVGRCLRVRQRSYAAANKRAEPYTKIVEELPQMRKETVQLVRQAVSAGRRAYVLVNNRAEGNAPLTLQCLAELL